ncbi:DUF5060 domain-containing protein [Catenovulum sediminis]|uniref:DUF5060 domain-containing protein n=1 Tax=Catenovulum sediminis TaxID=1740262 RepID=A0ABV1REG8_9ALTE|nr:DUF5060 domain-containing protein [Catenovulum sediminis]
MFTNDDKKWVNNSKLLSCLILFCATLGLSACANFSIGTAQPEIAKLDTFTLDITGPDSQENGQLNPFTDYRVLVEFIHPQQKKIVRGYYAADGNAGETSAQAGNIWRVKFTPQLTGQWQYKVHFDSGENIALSNNLIEGEATAFDGLQGRFWVSEQKVSTNTAANKAYKANKANRQIGFLTVQNGYFYSSIDNQPVLKVGANSPENLLGYQDFDGTYRIQPDTKDEGKAQDKQLHQYAPHIKDWQSGDLTWQNGKGKGLVGALNYLAAQDMNSVYFITMNIGGDGKDSWPYLDHTSFNRFDVSKLEQWQAVFAHMQEKGLLMHIILQETENELLLDNGDMGDQRNLYLREMIARFAHFPGIIWNIGEENGPVKWSPNGQTPEQVKQMARFIKKNDPYRHPVLVHSHASAKHKEETLTGLLGEVSIDGISLQVDQPHRAARDIQIWRDKSLAAGHQWAISMDEIGIWHTGARPDADNPTHDDMRTQVLWPSMFKKASGIEWYFGYRFAHNDLNAEDWRSRHKLWQQTKYAKQFFEQSDLHQLNYFCSARFNSKAYCLTTQTADRALVYLPSGWDEKLAFDLPDGQYALRLYSPRKGQWKKGQWENAAQTIEIRNGQPLKLVNLLTEKSTDWALEFKLLTLH